jgi:SAM-dependent methyltransferase
MISPDSHIDQLMQRIRTKQKAEIERDCRIDIGKSTWNSGSALAQDTSNESMPSAFLRIELPEPGAPSERANFTENANGAHSLKELTSFHDRNFIQNAYLAILHRAVDPGGLETYLNLLRGGMAKLEILGILRNGEEGRRAESRITGLAWRYRFLLASRLPILGRLIGVAHSIFSLAEAQREQRQFQGWAYATNETTQMTSFVASQESRSKMAAMDKALGNLAEELNECRASLNEEAVTTELRGQIVMARNEFRVVLDEHTTALQTKVDRGELETSLASLYKTVDARLAPKAELTSVVTAVQNIQRALEALETAKADRAEIGMAEGDIDAKITVALAPLRATMATLITSKAEIAFVEIAVQDMQQALESVATAKADRAEIVIAESDMDAKITAALAPLRATVATLSTSKAEVAFVEMAMRNMQRALESIVTAKADRAEMATTREDMDAKIPAALAPLVDKAVQNLRQSIESSLAAKADSAALLAVQTEASSRIETTAATLKEDGRLAQETARHQTEAVLRSAIHPLETRVADLRRNILDQERRVGMLLEEARKRLPAPLSNDQLKTMVAQEDHHLDSLYASFEDRFRGTRSDIKQRQSIYLPYIRDSKAGLANAPVIDLGCGRGEWLELLGEADLEARGIDVNRIFLAACREMDLNVTDQDVLTYLRGVKSASIGAVTSFHLIEHLSLKTLIAVFDESLRVLKPGGVAIFETPNPGNLIVGSCNFYFDPTHRNPLPAPLTQALLEIRGFSRTEILYLHPDTTNQLQPSDQPVQQTLNQFLYGPQDYAVLARKL